MPTAATGARTAPEPPGAALRARILFSSSRDGLSSRRNWTPMPWGFCGAAGSNALTQVTLPSPASATSPPASWISNAKVAPIGNGVRLAMKTPPRVTLGANLSMKASNDAKRSRILTGAVELTKADRVSAYRTGDGKRNRRRVFVAVAASTSAAGSPRTAASAASVSAM